MIIPYEEGGYNHAQYYTLNLYFYLERYCAPTYLTLFLSHTVVRTLFIYMLPC